MNGDVKMSFLSAFNRRPWYITAFLNFYHTDSRPSSTNAPQVMAQVPDEKRPQSLPPAPGVAAPTSILQMQRVNSLAIKGYKVITVIVWM